MMLSVQPAAGIRCSDDHADAAFLTERQKPPQRAGLEQRVRARDHEEVEIDEIGNAFAEILVRTAQPAIGVPRFQVAATADRLDDA